MKEVTLLLYIREEAYGRRLLRFLLNKKNPWLHPELVTEQYHVEKRVCPKGERLAVLTDSWAVQEDGKKEIIYLANEPDRDRKRIFQYQKAEGIYTELLTLLNLKPEQETAKCDVEKAEGIYSVFSPEGIGTTVVSIYLSQYLGCHGTCLYLSVAGFPVYYGEDIQGNPDFEKEGLSELLFSVMQEQFPERERKIRQSFGSAYMVPPMRNFKDILDCKPKEWRYFLKRLRADCGYDSIVVELGQLMEHTLDYMEMSDRIILLEREGICGRIRSTVFERYCEQEGKNSMCSKIQKIRPPVELSQWEDTLAEQSVSGLCQNGQVMSQVSGWIMERNENWYGLQKEISGNTGENT